MEKASIGAVNEVLSEAVADARVNHPGWKSRTGKLQGSIEVLQPAKREGSVIRGVMGSAVFYANAVEKLRGESMKVARDKAAATLPERIRRRFMKGPGIVDG